jgi:competence protein ComEA
VSVPAPDRDHFDHPDHPDRLGLAGPRPTAAERGLDLLAGLGLSPRGAAGLLGLVVLGMLGWWWLRAPATTAADALVPLAPTATSAGPVAPASTAPIAAAGTEVAAHAAGAVRRPGLYRLPAGSRVDDLLRAAGGALPRADLDRVNLAAPVADGSQVYVPRAGEGAGASPTVPFGAVPGTGPAGAVPGSGPGPSTPVNVNTADVATLDTLPGVGPATAAAIIEHREANGAFTSVDDLIDVPGIGEAKLAAMADLVTV